MTTVRLRPNADIATFNPWPVIGAATAWEALDDNVVESEPANNVDRIATGWSRESEVGLTTTSLSAKTVLSATAWFYTASSYDVLVEAKSNGQVLGTGSSNALGWHSFAVALDGSQGQLDNLVLRVKRGGTAGGTREVSAAFLKLELKLPPEKIYWGSWIDGETYGDPDHDAPWSKPIWDQFVEHTGNKDVAIIHFGQPPPWSNHFEPGPLNLSRARGAIPLMDMGSEVDKAGGGDVTLADIATGNSELVIGEMRDWAEEVAEYEHPFFFRWSWEMNGPWFQWGKEAKENPAMFVAAWRRFHDIAEEAGATNISWVWCPNVTGPNSPSPKHLYPGDGYVDWTCLDGYNWGGAEWTSFYNVFNQSYRELLALAPMKPIMIGETGSKEIGGSKATWITDALSTQVPNKFPEIRAFLWFNWNHLGREWPIESSASAQEAFASAVASPYYETNNFGLLPPLQPIEPLP